MSDYETHKGKMKKLETELSTEEFCQQKIQERNVRIWSDDIFEVFRDEFSDKYIIQGNDIWEIQDTELEDDSDILEYDVNEDGSISYMTRFYNGGACLSEQLEYILDKEIK